MRALYTIDTTTAQVRYAGNGVTTAFPVTFQFFESTTIRVQTVVDEAATTRVLNVDYTVSGGAGETGTVTFATAPPSGTTVVIDLDIPFLQETIDLAPNGPLPSEDVEQGFDRIVTMVKQLNARQGATPRLSAVYNPDDGEITLPVPEAGEFLMGNADGDGWINSSFPVPSGPDGNHPEFYAADYGVATTNTPAQNSAFLTAAIEAASLNGGGRVLLPRGKCQYLAIPSPSYNNVTIVGMGRFGGSTMEFMNSTGDCITFDTWGHLGIEDVYITAGVRRTSGFAIVVKGAAFTPKIKNIRIDYHWNGIWMRSCGEGIVEDISFRYMLGSRAIVTGGTTDLIYRITIRDIKSDNPYPHGNGTVKAYAPSTAFTLSDIVATNGKVWQCSQSGTTGASSAPSAIPGTAGADAFTAEVTDGTAKWKFLYDDNLIWLTLDSNTFSIFAEGIVGLNGRHTIYTADTVNTSGSHPTWLWFNDIEGDHNYDHAVLLDKGENFRCFNSWLGSSLTGSGMVISPGFKGEVLLRDTRVVANWQHGILWYPGPCAVRIVDNDIGHNSVAGAGLYHGIFMNGGVTQGQIRGNNIGPLAIAGWLSATNLQGYGIWLHTGATDNLIITDNDLRGNYAGTIVDLATGTNNRIRDNVGIARDITNILGADVNLSVTGTYYDGPSVAQGTVGRWQVSGHVTVQNAVGGDIVNVKLWDGTTVIASCRMSLVSVSGAYHGVAHLSGYITAPAGNLRISVSPVSRTDGVIAFNASGNSADCRIDATRVG